MPVELDDERLTPIGSLVAERQIGGGVAGEVDQGGSDGAGAERQRRRGAERELEDQIVCGPGQRLRRRLRGAVESEGGERAERLADRKSQVARVLVADGGEAVETVGGARHEE